MGDLIVNRADLEAVAAKAAAAGEVALDTEFAWMRTYRAALGIVQLGVAGDCFAVDCLKGMDSTALGTLLADAATTKILHDARQDLEHLHHWTGAEPVNVFDTQLAAAFAGFPSGMGLQRLLGEAIDVHLPKTQTLTDWLQRPLTSAQVDYALDDVRYLAALKDELLSRAGDFGTRAWLEEEMLRYDEPRLYDDCDPFDCWKRVKFGRAPLEGRHFAALREIAAVRETFAREWNVPRAWCGEDGSLVDMALHGEVGRFRHRLGGRPRDALAARYEAALARAAACDADDWPANPHPRYLREVVEAAERALAWMRERGAALHVDPGVIATRATVMAFIDNPEDGSNALARGWRFEAVGRDMASEFAVA